MEMSGGNLSGNFQATIMRENALSAALHQRFLECPQYARLLARTARAANGELNIAGLTDSAKTLILSLLMHEVKRPFFLIVPDNHVGARFHQEISNLSRYPVFFFPSAEVSPYEQVLSSPDNTAPQLELMLHIMQKPKDPYFVLVPARALVQRVLDPETLTRHNILLKVGEQLDPSGFAKMLVRLGYSKESLVTLRGEFSVRGDIIDVYPSSGMPVRIELFGDEVESIRVFNIENQRSVEEAKSILIPPRYLIVLDDQKESRQKLADKLTEVLAQAKVDLDEQASDTLTTVMENDLHSLKNGGYPESSEYYASFVHEKFCTITDYIPDSALVLFDEWDTLILGLQSAEEKMASNLSEGIATGRLLPIPRPLHSSVEELAKSLKTKQRVYLSTLPIFDEQGDSSRACVQFDCHPIERFGNQMQLMVDKTKLWRKEGYRVVISTDQPQRLLGLLREWDCPAEYVPGPHEDGTARDLLEGTETVEASKTINAANDLAAKVVEARKAGTAPANGKTKAGGEGAGNGSGAGGATLSGTGSGTGNAAGNIAENAAGSEAPVDAKSVPNLTSSAEANSSLSQLLNMSRSGGADNNAVWVTRNGFINGFRLADVELVSITDTEMFGLKRKPSTYRRAVVEKSAERFTSVADLKIGDYVVHIKQGIGQFVGVQRITVDTQQREYLTIQYAGEDRLYVPVDQINMLSRYRGAGDSAPRLSRLGGAEWETTKKRVKKSVKAVAEDLVNLYAMRAKQEGFASIPDTPWQYEMEEAFAYEETPDQWQAIVDTKRDLESNKPMDRLICGDVGFGKTEVAIRGIFKTIMSGKQAAILVPTTILAQQHFNTLSERFAPYPIRVGLLSRFRTAKEQREVVQRLASGECDVVVGTHRMLQKDIAFKDLGLIVIDEEQRFGVAHKEKLKQLRVMVDVLTMSATPIPRTLHMALSGARDMSLITTPPTNRAPIKTFVGEYKLPLVRTAILHEMERGGQVYFVHNRVESIEAIAHEVKQLVPEARVLIGHGQMQERELENVMLDFMAHQYDILVCTTIIESGLDIPNCNTIIINEADKLGLAQMYQLRGRVGRSDVQAYAYCLFRPAKVLSETAQNRLKAIREFTSLGSGYQIALRDMEIRGVGNILGAEQHGHMIAVGFDLYCKLLEESVAELKGESVAMDTETQIDINVTAFLPETYIADNEQRLIEYKRLADVKTERHLNMLIDEWKDRFGELPQEALQLVSVVRLRLLAAKAQVSNIKPEAQGIRLSVNFRLQHWLPIQNRLPKHLSQRTTYKPGQAGGHGSTPYILVRSQGISPGEQLSLLEELLSAMVAGAQEKAS
jgi:transcription-repair coupling factor